MYMKKSFTSLLLATVAAAAILTACAKEQVHFTLSYKIDQDVPPTYPYDTTRTLIPFEVTEGMLSPMLDDEDLTLDNIKQVVLTHAYVLFRGPDSNSLWFRELHVEMYRKYLFFKTRVAINSNVPGGSGYTGLPSVFPNGLVDSVALQINRIDLASFFKTDSVTIALWAGAGAPPGSWNDTVRLEWNFSFDILAERD
jgi:hypothetical protein